MGFLLWATGGHRETQNYAYQEMPGVRWRDSVAGRMMKDLEDCNDTTQRLILSLFPLFSCLHLSVVHSTVVVLHQGYPWIGAGKETPIASATADWLLLQILHLFQPRWLLLSNSVPLLFLTRFIFLQIFEPQLTWLQFFQMNVAFVCTMLSLLVWRWQCLSEREIEITAWVLSLILSELSFQWQ